MPTARNARGIDIVAYSRDGKKYIGIQVKSLSKRAPVPLGKSLDKIMGDFWVIINKATFEPMVYNRSISGFIFGQAKISLNFE